MGIFAIGAEGFSESITLSIPMIQSPDKKIELLLHPDDNSIGLNSYYPNIPSWLNSILRKENKPEIEKAIFINDSELLEQKMKEDSCLKEFVKAVQSKEVSRQLSKHLEKALDNDSIEEVLEKYYAEMAGQASLHWTKRGPLMKQVPLILKAHKDISNQQKLIVDYIRTGDFYFLQLSLIAPGAELLGNIKIEQVIGDKLSVQSCKISDQAMDKLMNRYLDILRTITMVY